MSDRITMAHGGGGGLTRSLVKDIIVSSLGNSALNRLDDSAVLRSSSGKLAYTTDSYVVKPLFFSGGDIGKLAVCGTVNDLAVNGARPLYLSLGLIIEEGFPVSDLKRIVNSIRAAGAEARVKVVCGDTKVVERGSADGIFINTSGIGEIPSGKAVSGSGARPGDAVIINGTLGDHGIAVLSKRNGLEFDTTLRSDCAPLNGLIGRMRGVHCMRDLTRGGLAAALREIAASSKVSIGIDESSVPVREAVRAACEMLGLDPLYVANEGKLVAFAGEKEAGRILNAMRKHKYGRRARIIGRVLRRGRGDVILNTSIGGRRMIEDYSGEQLPRIC